MYGKISSHRNKKVPCSFNIMYTFTGKSGESPALCRNGNFVLNTRDRISPSTGLCTIKKELLSSSKDGYLIDMLSCKR